MGLFRDAASIAIPELAAARAKKRQDSQSGSGSTQGGGQQQQKRSIGQDLGALAEKRLESGGKRPSSGMDFTSGSMSLTGDIPGQSADDSLGNGRRKRSNGKNRG